MDYASHRIVGVDRYGEKGTKRIYEFPEQYANVIYERFA
jgi:hypothetical protein